jgi:hypothetical protein
MEKHTHAPLRHATFSGENVKQIKKLLKLLKRCAMQPKNFEEMLKDF